MRYRLLVLLSFLLWVLPEALRCSVSTLLASPRVFQKEDFDYPTHRSVIADFDGDNQADLASGTLKGPVYRVEIQFSTRRDSASIEFTSSQLGFNLFALDIDQDNDQDLVITSISSATPLAIWLNEDNGHFEHGSRWWWVTLLASGTSSSLGDENFRRDPALLSQNQRFPLEDSSTKFKNHRAIFESILSWVSQRIPAKLLMDRLSTRSPPLSCLSC